MDLAYQLSKNGDDESGSGERPPMVSGLLGRCLDSGALLHGRKMVSV